MAKLVYGASSSPSVTPVGRRLFTWSQVGRLVRDKRQPDPPAFSIVPYAGSLAAWPAGRLNTGLNTGWQDETVSGLEKTRDGD